MDGTNRHEDRGACAATHAPLCPHCHREVATRVVVFTCVFCGDTFERDANLRGRPPLTCAKRACHLQLKREHAAARRARLKLAAATPFTSTPDVCRVCCYPHERCRCDNAARARVS